MGLESTTSKWKLFMISADGSLYKGFWKNDKEHGKGTITVKGVVIVGIWKDGYFVKEDEEESEKDKENSEKVENNSQGQLRIKPLSLFGKGSEASITNSIAVDERDHQEYGFFVSN